MSQILMGMSYVNVITLNYTRQNLFYSVLEEYSIWNPYNEVLDRYRPNLLKENWQLNIRYKDLKRVLLASLIVFFTSAVCVFRHKNSQTGGVCYSESLKDFEECYERGPIDFWSIWLQNLPWTLGYYLGLQITHLDFYE
mmetsp:Transcript_5415/g.9105  ORF Transcript_5415/g.9105 Transcript_5415/m.9105 type:complete len:139 (+) Transcript_5415:339-755(+)